MFWNVVVADNVPLVFKVLHVKVPLIVVLPDTFNVEVQVAAPFTIVFFKVDIPDVLIDNGITEVADKFMAKLKLPNASLYNLLVFVVLVDKYKDDGLDEKF